MSDTLTTLRAAKEVAQQVRGDYMLDGKELEALKASHLALIASMEAQPEPVAEIFWTNENPEWQLNMLVEPSCSNSERIKVYAGHYESTPLLYVGRTTAQPSEKEGKA